MRNRPKSNLLSFLMTLERGLRPVVSHKLRFQVSRIINNLTKDQSQSFWPSSDILIFQLYSEYSQYILLMRLFEIHSYILSAKTCRFLSDLHYIQASYKIVACLRESVIHNKIFIIYIALIWLPYWVLFMSLSDKRSGLTLKDLSSNE